MTQLTDFLAGRGPTDMYETYWVPCTLWPFAVALAELTSPGDKVLDIGAGTGLLTDLASARTGSSGQITALEPTPFMLELLQRKYQNAPNITFVEGTIETAVFADDTFDVALCHQVIQYVDDLPGAFARIRRVLKPGGRLGVGVWSGPEDQAVSALEDGFREHLGAEFAPIHAWSFGGLNRLKELAEGAGFSVDVLEKQVRLARFKSIDEMLNVHIAGGMRVVDGEVIMGIFDLADASFVPRVEALLSDLRRCLAEYEGPSGFIVPFASDVVIATA